MAAKKSDLVVIFERNNYKGKQQIVENKRTGEFFWRRIAANNVDELSRSSETYETLAGCLKGMRADNANVKTWLGDITVKSVRQWK
jgi:hypothetical protein